MTTITNGQVRLASQPSGMPTPDNRSVRTNNSDAEEIDSSPDSELEQIANTVNIVNLMRKSSSTVTPKFYQPGPADYDFTPLVAALKSCRAEVMRLRYRCGTKSIMFDETQVLADRLDHFAEIIGIRGGSAAIQTIEVGHTSGGTT
jgi:hypothetical protein